LVLRIGLPLVAGLNLRQFAGVLAHEFGHFSQGAGMRLAVVIMSINSWFARVVYERDSWDEGLAQWSTSGGTEVMILVGLIRLSIWLTRRILWVLMWVGHLVSVSLRRQMEYDADRYEARMVGGAVFGETMERVRLMGLASNGAHSDLQSSWCERRMPDNFPKLVLANIPQIPKELVAASRQGIDSGTTDWLDLYPCDKDRMAHAAIEEPGQGIFHLQNARAAHLETIAAWDLVFKRLSQARIAIISLEVGMPIKAVQYGLKESTAQAAQQALGQDEAEFRRVVSLAQPFGAMAALRLAQALALLEVDAVADRIADGHDRREEARAGYPSVVYLGSHLGDLMSSLVMHRSVLIGMAEIYQAARDPKPQPTINGLLRAAENVRNALEGAQLKISDSLYYPFEHAQADITLSQFVFSHALPDKNDIGALMEMSEEVINRLYGLYLRSLGRLAVTVEMVEEAMGLPPIEVAETDDGN
jgi:Peptidase family M48